MSDPGIVTGPPIPPGQQLYSRGLQDGYTAQDMDGWKQRMSQRLLDDGFKPDEIGKYWGENTGPPVSLQPDRVDWAPKQANESFGERALQNIEEPFESMTWQGAAKVAKNFLENIQEAGKQINSPAAMASPVGAGVAAIQGAIGKTMDEINSPDLNDIRTVLTTPIPEAAVAMPLRHGIVESYRNGEIQQAHQAVDHLLAPAAEAGAQSQIAGVVPQIAHHIPDTINFKQAAHDMVYAPLVGSDTTQRIEKNLQDVYSQVGMTPWHADAIAHNDPVVRDELVGQDLNGDPVTPKIKTMAPKEPNPIDQETQDKLKRIGEMGRQRGAENAGMTGAEGSPVSTFTELAKPKFNSGKDLLPLIETTENTAGYVRAHGGTIDDTVSYAGAIGKYQVMPGTARQYGFDPARLKEAEYNAHVAETILDDLSDRYRLKDGSVDVDAVLVAYNAGPGRANRWLASGRDLATLPDQTVQYLDRAAKSSGYEGTAGREIDEMEHGGEGGAGKPPPPPPPTGGEGGEPPQLPGPKPVKYSEDVIDSMINDHIGEPPTKPSDWGIGKLYRQMVNELAPFESVDKKLEDMGLLDRTTDVSVTDMFRQTYASDGRFKYFLKKGTLDPVTLTETSPVSFEKVLEAAKKGSGTVEQFRNYLIARRAQELQSRDIETPFEKLGDNVIQQKVDYGKQKFGEAEDLLRQWNDATLAYGKDSKLFNDKQVAAMKQSNQNYVRFARVMDVPLLERGPSARNWRVRNPVDAIEGSDRQILDPILATIENKKYLIRMADRNRAVGAIVGAAKPDTIPGQKLLEQLGELGLKRLEQPKVEMAAAGENIFKTYNIYEPELKEAMEPFLAQKVLQNSGRGNHFVYIRDGKPEFWEATNPDLAQAIRRADTPGEANVIVKTFQKFAQLERSGIVTAPDFPTRVTLRHQMTAYILDRASPPPFVTWWKGAMSVWGKDENFWQAMANGIDTVSLQDIDRNFLDHDIQKIFEETNTWKKMWNVVRHPIQAAQTIGHFADQAARTGYFKHANEIGYSPLKSGTMARTAILDYVQKGSSTLAQQMAKAVPFQRPHLLGMEQMVKAFKERPGSTLAKTMLSVVAPQVLLYGLNYLQDEYGGIPEDEKYRNLNQMTRDSAYVFPQIGGVRLRIPLPYMVGPLFGGLTNRVLDSFRDKHAPDFESFALLALDTVLPPAIPALILPAAQAVTNRTNFFTGQPLVSDKYINAHGPMQYTDATSTAAKELAKVLPAIPIGATQLNSPIVLDNFIRGWTGSIGMAALKAVDGVFKPSGKPWEVADIPFAGSFFARSAPGMQADLIRQFYDAATEYQKAHGDVELARQRMREEQPGAENEMVQSFQEPSFRVQRMERALHMMQSVIEGIDNNRKMSTDEKRQAVDSVTASMIATAKAGLTMMGK